VSFWFPLQESLPDAERQAMHMQPVCRSLSFGCLHAWNLVGLRVRRGGLTKAQRRCKYSDWHPMTAPKRERKRTRRKGKPFTLYLPESQMHELSRVCRSRHITKAEAIRVAVSRLLEDLRGGQLELPLGLEHERVERA